VIGLKLSATYLDRTTHSRLGARPRMTGMNGRRGLPPNLIISLLLILGFLFVLGTLEVLIFGHTVGLRILALVLIITAYLGYLGMRLFERDLRRLGLDYDPDQLDALQERATPQQQELMARVAALRWLASACLVLAIGFYLLSLVG
jgi:hypothetical protein